jgi:hypothetical protein
MKNPHHFAVRPQYHWSDQKVRVHMFICLLALMPIGDHLRQSKSFAGPVSGQPYD